MVNVNNRNGFPISKQKIGYSLVNSILEDKNRDCSNIFVQLNNTTDFKSNTEEYSTSNVKYSNNTNNNKIKILDNVEIVSASKPVNFLESRRKITIRKT